LKKILSAMILRISALIVQENNPDHISPAMSATTIIEQGKKWKKTKSHLIGSRDFFPGLFLDEVWEEAAVSDNLAGGLAVTLEILVLDYIKSVKRLMKGGKSKADGASAVAEASKATQDKHSRKRLTAGPGLVEMSVPAPAVAEASKATQDKHSGKRLTAGPGLVEMSVPAPAVGDDSGSPAPKKRKSSHDGKPADQAEASSAGAGNAPKPTSVERLKLIQQRLQERLQKKEQGQ
jgi:hypothetical protein